MRLQTASMRVEHVEPGNAAINDWNLEEPGRRVREGDVIVEVNGYTHSRSDLNADMLIRRNREAS